MSLLAKTPAVTQLGWTLSLVMLLSLTGSSSSDWADGPVRISVYPAEFLLLGRDAEQVLAVTAEYADGLLVRDVTAQASFDSEDPRVVTVREGGVVSAGSPGRTVVRVQFEGRQASAGVLVRESGDAVGVSFVRDIAPILTQMGCAGANCHGSIRGKAHFKLSLFNSRPQLDYEELLERDGGRLVNLEEPEHSLILQNARGENHHGGGERFTEESLQHQAIVEWLSRGAPYDSGNAPVLERVEVYPTERFLVKGGSTQRLVVTGLYSDGVRRDLTRRAQYTSGNEGVVTVDESGVVTARRWGETTVLARVLGNAAAARLAVIDEPPGLTYPLVPRHNLIDDFVFSKLRRLNIIPSELAGDSIFIRRVFLDTLGLLPTPDETREFLASEAPDKRSRLVDDLLERPEFSDLWAMKFADLFQVGHGTGVKGGERLFRWLRHSLQERKPHDRLVRDLMTGTGPFVFSATANFHVGLMEGPEGMATQVSQALLGVRLECARCHDHPFERWTQDDFYGLAAFFTHLERKAEPYGQFEHAVVIRPSHKPTFDFLGTGRELTHPHDDSYLQPKFLDGPSVEVSGDPRPILAEWITDPANPWFAKAFVNRIWKHFLGRGLVEEVDDFRETNPASNEALLAALADYFTRAGYDLRQLVRLILNSRAYHLSSVPNETNQDDTLNYSRFYLKRMIAEVQFDALGQAAGHRLKIPGYAPGERAISVAVGAPNYFLRTFGKPTVRDTLCERDAEVDVAQVMHLISGETIHELLTAPDNIVARVLVQSDWSDERRIDEIYLNALARFPTEEEAQEVHRYLAEAEGAEERREVFQDLLWAIFNSKEFAYIH